MINRLIFILSLAGLLISGYLLERYLSGGRIACGSDFGCDLVRKSSYSHFYGLPLPLFGLVYYLMIAVASFLKTIYPFKILNFALFAASFIGLLASLYLFYLEVAVIRAICFWCAVSGLLTLQLFLLSLIFLKNGKIGTA